MNPLNIRKSFGDGTELSLYRRGWVTLSGLPCAGAVSTIEYRQEALDQIVRTLWPELMAKAASSSKAASSGTTRAFSGEAFVLDWNRTASEDRIRQFIQGLNRTAKQVEVLRATWELRRRWNHGTTPDASMYTKRIVEEALWLRPIFAWTLQDVVDIVITFCKKNELHWSFTRAEKQLLDAQRFILTKHQQQQVAISSRPSDAFPPRDQHHHTLTCTDSRLIAEQAGIDGMTLTERPHNNLLRARVPKLADSFPGFRGVDSQPKLSADFRRRSAPRTAILDAIKNHPGWVKYTTIAAEISKGSDAVRKQLSRLAKAGLVDRDGKGRYRQHHERRLRDLKPCWLKPFPRRRDTAVERQTISRTGLKKRGWPIVLIDRMFPKKGEDYIEKDLPRGDRPGLFVRAKFYWVRRIKAIEQDPWFEIERARIRHEEHARKANSDD